MSVLEQTVKSLIVGSETSIQTNKQTEVHTQLSSGVLGTANHFSLEDNKIFGLQQTLHRNSLKTQKKQGLGFFTSYFNFRDPNFEQPRDQVSLLALCINIFASKFAKKLDRFHVNKHFAEVELGTCLVVTTKDLRSRGPRF